MVKSLDESIRDELVRRYDLYGAAQDDVELQDALYERCRRDPRFWARNFIWTYDTRRPPYRIPFVFFDYQLKLFELFLGEEPRTRTARRQLERRNRRLRRVVVDKCRDTGVSWVTLAAMVYAWQFRVGSNFGVISRKKEEVDDGSEGSLFGKLRVLIKSQPPWMRPPGFRNGGPFDKHRFDDKYMLLINRTLGNVIAGSTTTASAFRSRRYSRVFIDEGAAIPLLFDMLKSINDVTPGAWVVSTPFGMNDFGQLVHGEYGKVVKYGDEKDDGNGWVHFRISYDMDPRKDEAWLEGEMAERSETEIAQELLLDYDASDPRARILPEFSRARHLLSAESWRRDYEPMLPMAKIVEGWDFGVGPSLTAVVWCAYWEASNILVAFDYRLWHEATPSQVAADIAAMGWYASAQKDGDPRGQMPALRVGDPAMNARDAVQKTWRRRLAKHGIELRYRRRALADAIMNWRECLGAGRLQFAPATAKRYPGMKKGLPTLVESVSQYKRDTPENKSTVKDYVGNSPNPRADLHSHVCDALSYAIEWTWVRTKQGQRRSL